jgi:hypothetical protein
MGSETEIDCFGIHRKDAWRKYSFPLGRRRRVIITVFDPINHRPIDGERIPDSDGYRSPILNDTEDFDQRWVRCRRPFVFTGGELTLEMLDLSFNEISKFYEAPFQVKANGGVFLIDDFGRQLVRPKDLLNRWIVPLEKRVDYLTLHTGKKFEVPFDALITFSTTWIQELVDEAFFRRIRYKVPSIHLEQYEKSSKIIAAAGTLSIINHRRLHSV